MNNLKLFFLAPFFIVISYSNGVSKAIVVRATQYKIVKAFMYEKNIITWQCSGQLVQTNFNNSLLNKKWSWGNTINVQASNL